jgi:hypothetical protein
MNSCGVHPSAGRLAERWINFVSDCSTRRKTRSRFDGHAMNRIRRNALFDPPDLFDVLELFAHGGFASGMSPPTRGRTPPVQSDGSTPNWVPVFRARVIRPHSMNDHLLRLRRSRSRQRTSSQRVVPSVFRLYTARPRGFPLARLEAIAITIAKANLAATR